MFIIITVQNWMVFRTARLGNRTEREGGAGVSEAAISGVVDSAVRGGTTSTAVGALVAPSVAGDSVSGFDDSCLR